MSVRRGAQRIWTLLFLAGLPWSAFGCAPPQRGEPPIDDSPPLAHAASEHGQLAFPVDDADAAYPVELDLLLAAQQGKLVASNGEAYDRFGASVAVSGDTAVVGAPARPGVTAVPGKAYVFVRSNGAWTEEAELIPSSGFADAFIGCSVAVSGDIALVGETGYYRANSFSAWYGYVHVFVRSGGVWTQEATLGAPDNFKGDWFGQSVALSGETALVGSPFMYDEQGVSTGAAYVIQRNGGVWTTVAKLVADDRESGDTLGMSVAFSGDTALLGAPAEDENGVDAGSAYVFTNEGGTWAQKQKLLASDGAAGDAFGASVALSGDTALVGAPTNDAKAFDAGSAYVFKSEGGRWSQKAKLTASDANVSDQLGAAVALSGDVALVGARYTDDSGTSAGSAYLYQREGDTWVEQSRFFSDDTEAGDYFGAAVALSGQTALVGAPRADEGGTEAGAAYAFTVTASAGTPCMDGTLCQSGLCVDGVCCDSECGGGDDTDCQACSVAKGAPTDGTCSPVVAGTECRASTGDCDPAETCDGASDTCPADAKAPSGAGSCIDSSGGAGGGGAGGAGGAGGGQGGSNNGGEAGNGGQGGADQDSGCDRRAAGTPPTDSPYSKLSVVGLALLGAWRRRKQRVSSSR
ncbi:MAG: hypothetical protein R3F14_30465 [Polyangiaceae bacterium]